MQILKQSKFSMILEKSILFVWNVRKSSFLFFSWMLIFARPEQYNVIWSVVTATLWSFGGLYKILV